MKITELKFNLRGQTRSIKPGPVNVIIGDNAAGKSMVLAAVRLALLGKDSRLGGRNTDAFALSDGNRMFVDFTLENGESVHREWNSKAGGGCSYVSNENEGKSAGYSILLDPSEWLDSPARDKAEYLFSIAGDRLKEFSVHELIAKLKRGIKVETPTEHSERALADLSDELLKVVEKETKPQVVAAKIAEAVNEKKKKVRFEKDAAAKAIAAAAANAAREGLESAPNVDGELKKAKGELAKFGMEIGGLNEKVEAFKKYEAAVPATAEAYQPGIDLEASKAEYERLNSIPVYESKTATLLSESGRVRACITANNKERESILERSRVLAAQFDREQSATRCPCCNAEGESWKASHKKKFEDALTACAEPLAESNQTSDNLFLREKQLYVDLEASRTADKENLGRLETLRNLENCIANENSRKSAFEKQQAAVKAIAKPEGTRAEIEARRTDTVNMMESLRQTILQLEQSQKRWVASCSRKVELEKHADNQKRFEAEAEVWSQAEKGMKELQKAMMTSVFGPILETARLFTDGLLDAPLELRDMELGREKDVRWIPYQAFSGFEKALTFAGLGVALAHSSPVKVVMMDEVNFGDKNKLKINARMMELVLKGVIDHFFVTDTAIEYWSNYTCPGVEIIKA